MRRSADDMLLFATVVREGSFTRAARQLGITKQTASERVGKLEQQLGVRLLERTTRHLRLTDAGAPYYERCAAIAAQIEEAESEVQQLQSEPVGLLRVSAPVLFGRRFLGPIIAQLMARYPRVRVEVVLADRRVQLIDEGIDVAIRVGALDDSSLAARKLSDGHIYYVASPAFVRRAGLSPDLRDARCIGMRSFETWSLGGERFKIEPVLVVNDLEIGCEAAIAGIGIARLPSLVCREAVEAGALRILYGAEAAMVTPVHAVYPSRQYLPAKARVFLEALSAHSIDLRPLARRRPPPRA
jgi:DNA-binding transcriptional LysR family regulator